MAVKILFICKFFCSLMVIPIEDMGRIAIIIKYSFQLVFQIMANSGQINNNYDFKILLVRAENPRAGIARGFIIYLTLNCAFVISRYSDPYSLAGSNVVPNWKLFHEFTTTILLSPMFRFAALQMSV